MTDANDALPEGYTETFRSDVPPWEVDIVEHFTVAYYYEKFMTAHGRLPYPVSGGTAQRRPVPHPFRSDFNCGRHGGVRPQADQQCDRRDLCDQ